MLITCQLFTGAFLCSVQYHLLHPNYIHERLKQLGKSFDLRILLVLVDVVRLSDPCTGISCDVICICVWTSPPL